MATPQPHVRSQRMLLAALLALVPLGARATDSLANTGTDAAALVPPAPETVLAVPPELQRMLQTKVIDATRSHVGRAELLTHFLFADDGLHVQYQPGATHDVAEAFDTRRADCLGFTILAVALARAAGLHAQGQELERILARDLDADTAIQITHANAGLSASGHRYVIDIADDELFGAPPPHAVSDARLLAMFYDNRAMELMIGGQLEAANAWLQAAMREDADYPVLWNNAAVLAHRGGDMATAERDLLHTLQLAPKNSAALFNLIGLYRQQGNTVQAEAWQQRAEKALRRDPFHQYVLGRTYERDGNYAEAERHYRLAIHFDHNVHQFHFALARTYFLEGQPRHAGAELARASQLSSGHDHDAYQAKLDKLRQMLH